MKKVLFLAAFNFVVVPSAQFTQSCSLFGDDNNEKYLYYDKSLSLNPFVENYMKNIILNDDQISKFNFEVNEKNLQQITEGVKTFIGSGPNPWSDVIDLNSVKCFLSYSLSLEDYDTLKNGDNIDLNNAAIIAEGTILNLTTDNFVINVNYQKRAEKKVTANFINVTDAIAIYNTKINLQQVTSSIVDLNLGSFVVPEKFTTLNEMLSTALYEKIVVNKNIINSSSNLKGILRNFITQPYSPSFEADEDYNSVVLSYDYNFDFSKIKITSNLTASQPLEIVDVADLKQGQTYNVEFIGNQTIFSGDTSLTPFTFSIKVGEN